MRKLFILVLIFTLFGFAYGDDLSEYEKDLIQRVKELFGEDVSRPKVWTEPFPLHRCGTPLMGELKYKFESLSPEAEKILKPYLQRPSLNDPDSVKTLNTPSGYFKIHYTVYGPDSVYKAHTDTNSNGVPDYVDRCAVILDSVKAFEIDSLGYATPPSDGAYGGGGDARYDVYLLDLGPGYLGYCQSEAWNPYPKATSYIVLRNDYIGYGYPDQFDLFRVTSAHEFFHAIQFGYDATEGYIGVDWKPYWLEISSVWMEDVAYDNINDYLGYLPYFFQYPQYSLETFSPNFPDPKAYHCYASCIWAMYLTEKHGIDIMKDIWTACAKKDSSNVIPATDSILSLKGSSYDDAFREFTVWNFFTNTRAITSQFYSEGDLFDANSKINPVPGQFHDFSSLDTFYKSSVSYPPEHLGSNYVFFYPKTTSGGARLYFYGDSTASWRVSIIGYESGTPVYLSEITLDSLQNGNTEVPNANLYTNLMMVPAVTDKSGAPWNFSYAGAWDSLLVEVKEDENKKDFKRFHLSQNYPNPFNPTTTIPFTVHGKQKTVNSPLRTTLIIYNILGQKIRTLVDEDKLPGEHKIIWDGKDDSGFEVSSGVYFYKLKAGDFEEIKRLVFLK